MRIRYTVLASFAALGCSSQSWAFDTNVPQTFDQLCAPNSSGFPADADVVNCWGFESEDAIYYRDPGGSTSTCIDPVTGQNRLASHIHGINNSTPVLNAGVNSENCLYPERVSSFSASGGYSLRIMQVDQGGPNGGGWFSPYLKHYVGGDGKRKFAGFGKGGEFWIHWRYRQDQGLFNYHSKRFMVTHEQSSYEHVLTAFGTPTGSIGTPPYKYICAYNNKGTYSYGCSTTKFYEANKWHTILMHVKVADNADSTNGIFELYFDGEQIFSENTFPMQGTQLLVPYSETLDWDTQHDINALVRLDFLLFENNKTGVGTRPPGAMWIDDVIVSKKRPPTILPSGGSNEPAPNAPQNLTAN